MRAAITLPGPFMSNLLYLVQRMPYPPNRGDKMRPLETIRHFWKSYNVYLGCLVDDPRDLEHVPTMQALCKDSCIVPLDRRRARLMCLTGLLTGEPLSVTFYHDRGLARWVQRVLREVRPEVIFVSSSNMAPYVLDLRGPERVCLIDLGDIDSEKWRAYSQSGSPIMRWVHAREWRLMTKLETRIACEADWSTFCTDQEAASFARLHPDCTDRIRAVSTCVDHEYFNPAHRFDAPYPKDGLNFVFTGTMDYPPNVDAVTWFVSEVLPIIQRNAPDARFHIVGNNPIPKVKTLASAQGVSVTGRVPDVRPYVAHSTAAVAPLRIARGVQTKVLEAMAMGKPVVVTPGALEGIKAEPGSEILLADTPEDLAAACLRTAMPEGLEIGVQARNCILHNYSWPEQLRRFDELLAAIPAERRKKVVVP